MNRKFLGKVGIRKIYAWRLVWLKLRETVSKFVGPGTSVPNKCRNFSKTNAGHYIQRRDSIMAWSVILSVYGADPIAEIKLISILLFTISCRLVFKHLLFHLDLGWSRKWLFLLTRNSKVAVSTKIHIITCNYV
jgi:hypothetical protein